MKINPTLIERAAQPYVGIRTKATMSELSAVIPQSHDAILAWLQGQGLAPAGPPFVRYYDVSDMANQLDLEMGWPVAAAISGADAISADTLPAGRYLSLVYTGHYDNLERVTGELLLWAKENGITWQMKGQEWISRVEIYHTDPAEEPNPDQWETELAFMVADH